MDVDLTIPSYIILAIVVYYGVLFVMSHVRPRREIENDKVLFVVVVPARNEERVLAATIADLTELQPASRCRVLVIDDGSTDTTADIADAFASSNNRVRVLHRGPAEAGRGKSDVLNTAYRLVASWATAADPWLDGAQIQDIVIGIVDADGSLDPNALSEVSGYFRDPMVASVQIGVRIGNAGRSALARMQDMEFVGFSWLVQIARDHLGSSGLGGNGQFTKLLALDSLAPSPWTPGALTEDLDLGLKLIAAGWRTRFCHRTTVTQQGLETWRPLLRQRTRWIQGHYQCWRHIGSVVAARRARLATRLDILTYLLLVVTVLLVSATMLASTLGYFGVIDVSNRFLDFVPDGTPRRVISLACSLLPVTIFMWTYQRHSRAPFRWYEVPAFCVIFTLYTYVWLLTSVRALTRMALRRNAWIKTPRVATAVS